MLRTLFGIALVSLLAFGLSARTHAEDVDVSALGDLSAFKTISEAAVKSLGDNDLAAGKAKMKELESEWDAAEATLKPKSAKAWTWLDKKIDHALFLVRAAKPEADKCKDAVQELVDAFTPAKK